MPQLKKGQTMARRGIGWSWARSRGSEACVMSVAAFRVWPAPGDPSFSLSAVPPFPKSFCLTLHHSFFCGPMSGDAGTIPVRSLRPTVTLCSAFQPPSCRSRIRFSILPDNHYILFYYVEMWWSWCLRSVWWIILQGLNRRLRLLEPVIPFCSFPSSLVTEEGWSCHVSYCRDTTPLVWANGESHYSSWWSRLDAMYRQNVRNSGSVSHGLPWIWSRYWRPPENSVL